MEGAMSDHTNGWGYSRDGRWSRVEGRLLLEAGQRSETICWARISVLGDHASLLRRRSIIGDVEAAKNWADKMVADYAGG
jgi:hypothetical protein